MKTTVEICRLHVIFHAECDTRDCLHNFTKIVISRNFFYNFTKNHLFKWDVNEWVSLMATTLILSELGGVTGGFTLNLITWGYKGPGVFKISSQASVGAKVLGCTEIGSKIDILIFSCFSFLKRLFWRSFSDTKLDFKSQISGHHF